jgi:GDSL-like Lipase/Acylhydrolase family
MSLGGPGYRTAMADRAGSDPSQPWQVERGCGDTRCASSHMRVTWGCRLGSRLSSFVIGAVVLLSPACSEVPDPSPVGSGAGPSNPTIETVVRLVVLGDSIASQTTCPGCSIFPDQVATKLGVALGARVQVNNLSWDVTNPKAAEVADILTYVRNDSTARDALADADGVLINVAQNDLAYNRVDDPCGVAPDYPKIRWEDLTHDCIDATLVEYRRDLNALLDEIDALREGRPTMLRVVTGYNSALGDLVDPTWNEPAAIEPTTYNVSQMMDVQCDLASQHGGMCADAYSALNGADRQQSAQPYLNARDATHPNQDGHDKIAAVVIGLGFEPLVTGQ